MRMDTNIFSPPGNKVSPAISFCWCYFSFFYNIRQIISECLFPLLSFPLSEVFIFVDILCSFVCLCGQFNERNSSVAAFQMLTFHTLQFVLLLGKKLVFSWLDRSIFTKIIQSCLLCALTLRCKVGVVGRTFNGLCHAFSSVVTAASLVSLTAFSDVTQVATIHWPTDQLTSAARWP